MEQNKAYFSFMPDTANDLSILFSDRSFGASSNQQWSFGFTDPLTETEKVSTETTPRITFPGAGSFVVSLTATIDNASYTYTKEVLVGQKLSIVNMVNNELTAPIEDVKFNILIKKWQIYLQPYLNIPDASLFNENDWPILANILISKLINYDLFLEAARKFASGAGTANGSSGSTGAGGIKTIETGPSHVEWYDPTTRWATIFKSTVSASGNTGFLDTLLADTCMYAKRLGVILSFCKYGSVQPMFSILHHRKHKNPLVPRDIPERPTEFREYY